jgi:guanylate kinase
MAEDAAVGSQGTKLLVIRGNSGSGKSSVAREVRRRHGRGMALVELSHRPLGVRDVREAGGS